MGEKLFRTRLFGYKKSDVSNYFQHASEKFAQKLAQVNEQNEVEERVLSQKLADANERIEELIALNEKYEKSKEIISEVIIKAQQSAIAIEDEAKAHANEITAEAAKAVAREQEVLRMYRTEATNLRREVASAIKRFSSELSV